MGRPPKFLPKKRCGIWYWGMWPRNDPKPTCYLDEDHAGVHEFEEITGAEITKNEAEAAAWRRKEEMG